LLGFLKLLLIVIFRVIVKGRGAFAGFLLLQVVITDIPLLLVMCSWVRWGHWGSHLLGVVGISLVETGLCQHLLLLLLFHHGLGKLRLLLLICGVIAVFRLHLRLLLGASHAHLHGYFLRDHIVGKLLLAASHIGVLLPLGF
jgi:hypothetical protein